MHACDYDHSLLGVQEASRLLAVLKNETKSVTACTFYILVTIIIFKQPYKHIFPLEFIKLFIMV